MDENKEVQTTTEQAKDTKKKSAKKEDKKKGRFFAEHKAEFKKIVWPTRDDLVKETITVIVISLIVGIIIFGMDTVLKLGYNSLIGLGTNGSSNTGVETQLPIDANINSDDFDVEIATEGVADETEVIEEITEAADENVTEAADEAVTNVAE